MATIIGLDIGGSKVAGAAYDAAGKELEKIVMLTPSNYGALVENCCEIVAQLEHKFGRGASVGVGVPHAAANMSFLYGKPLRQDLEKRLKRPVPCANDANLAAYAEAVEGAGVGHRSVFGLILGTGVGGGLIYNQQIVTGPNDLSGEIGHIPLPFYEESDGPRVACGCGQTGCIEKLVAGAALARLYEAMTGKPADTKQIGTLAGQGDADALRVLDRFFTVVAKAMVVVLHSFDPDIITVSGGLNALPGLYVEVPKRWGKYAISKNPVTKFVPASFGSMAGMRGAALLGKNS